MSDINENKLQKRIRISCDKHEIRGEEKEKIEKWVQYALLQYGLLKSIESGHIEICGINPENKEVLFQLTDAGKKSIEKLMKM